MLVERLAMVLLEDLMPLSMFSREIEKSSSSSAARTTEGCGKQ